MADSRPAPVSILRHGSHLIASIRTSLDDSQRLRFHHLGTGTGSLDTALDLEDGFRRPAGSGVGAIR